MTVGAVTTCEVAIRPLASMRELNDCVEMQRSVWGWSDVDLMPLRCFVLMQHAGGLVLGAHADDRLVGFVNCVPGIDNGQCFWHSHMLAVLPAYRDRGIGTALKLAQREHARLRYISSIQWVFDPLAAKNAYLNIAKLGAVIRRYSINHYGASTSSLHTGLESDRLVAEWRVDGRSVTCCPLETRTLAIPADVQTMKHTDLDAARALQRRVREEFLRNFADGFIATQCRRCRGGIEYVFQREIGRDGHH
jgi:predicted GNAT superfamily acetyltransferase